MADGASDEVERALARQSRRVAVVMVGAFALWIGLQWVGGALGWPVRYAFLIDLLALAAFAWALVTTYRIWRRRRDMGS